MMGKKVIEKLIEDSEIKDKIYYALQTPAIKDITKEEFKKTLRILFLKLLKYSSIKPPEQIIKEHVKSFEENSHIIIFINDFKIDPKEKTSFKLKLYNKLLEISKDYWYHVILFSDIEKISKEGDYELFKVLVEGEILYETEMLSILKMVVYHQELILNRFKNLIVSYVLAGSLVKGRLKETSDIDVYIIIDDTSIDIPNIELKQKITEEVLFFGVLAKNNSKCKRILHPQVYTLTEFWNNIKDVNPVIITFLRDGIALYDKAVFNIWKKLLKLGYIQPSEEAVFKYLELSNDILKHVKERIEHIITQDFYYAVLTTMQALIMSKGILPPDPKETINYVRKIFVEEEKILNEEDIKLLEDLIKIRKEIEHNKDNIDIKNKYIQGQIIDLYLDKITRFINKIEIIKDKIQKEKLIEEIKKVLIQYYKIKKEIETLFEKNISDILKETLPVYLEDYKIISKKIKDYEKNLSNLSIIELKSFKKEILKIIDILSKFLEQKKLEILKERLVVYIPKEKIAYDVYILKNGHVFLVKPTHIERYDFTKERPELIEKIDKNKIEDLLIEINKEKEKMIPITYIDKLKYIIKQDFKIIFQ